MRCGLIIVGHWDVKCGRPLGMRLDAQGKHLFVADGQLGLLKVDLSSGIKMSKYSYDVIFILNLNLYHFY